MRKGKYAARRTSGMKAMTMLLALVLVVGCAIGGTLAWLVDDTDEVTNTFTTADIEVNLTETPNTDTDNDGVNDAWKAQMIPGYAYAKDPKVEVSAESVDCYLFVKFEETNAPSTYLTYTSTLTGANGWTQGDGEDIPANVWYRTVKATDTTHSWELLTGEHDKMCDNAASCICPYAHGKISVKDTVTKGNMEAAVKATLTYTAYASQLYKSAGVPFTAAEAWENVPKS